ncbi:hypothetical protein [Lysobacter capsici]|jgi:hypothetical protein|uniref:hypothetical protein n=1 Tax=Lysobacter capsici TaxID=435897 RepID=UPI0012905E41|nr:hypothetical protein [Lysobacter capsici]WND78229.1 hypothetical protein RJ610_12975 [Lysobacter capsici]WND83423.1 hypothetical protein RJ609_12985 [Lysobacter capsici]
MDAAREGRESLDRPASLRRSFYRRRISYVATVQARVDAAIDDAFVANDDAPLFRAGRRGLAYRHRTDRDLDEDQSPLLICSTL